MYPSLLENIQGIQKAFDINEERKNVLLPLIGFIQKKRNDKQRININFICTHNSRRSHLSQI